MKIESITVQGFRGFNLERTLDFHRDLTVICAANSYGKTSISEALEWLFYGITSKVEHADYSKDEYKGSYRNLHLPEELLPWVSVVFLEGDKSYEWKAELLRDDSVKRYVDGKEVDAWPIACDCVGFPRPFILQHALKELLLVKPDDRFSGFAALLGLDELDELQRNVVALCTKPSIPVEAATLIRKVEGLESRIAEQPAMTGMGKALKRGAAGADECLSLIDSECRARVPAGTPDGDVARRLSELRDERVAKVFQGHVSISGYSDSETSELTGEEQFFLQCVSETFVQRYARLVELSAIQEAVERLQFFDLGAKLIIRTPGRCPFCSQTITPSVREHIRTEHSGIVEAGKSGTSVRREREEIERILLDLRKRLSRHRDRHLSKVQSYVALEGSLDVLQTIMTPKYASHFQTVNRVVGELKGGRKALSDSFLAVQEALDKVDASIAAGKESATVARALAGGIASYVGAARLFARLITEKGREVAEADRLLQTELDTLAGTEDISLLLELMGARDVIRRKLEIDGILNGLKELRKIVDQFVATRVSEAISGELTSEVMAWYGQIRTSGDPDVHFGGFDMERTTGGDLKGRRVRIKAVSYGEELVSAVACLSESKLNALGLCVSIAQNLKRDQPFEFIIIDDPIQSWDSEHEVQFIEVLRELVNRRKQIILLSHNAAWVELVCRGCRSLNGWRYDITGYSKEGPHISKIPWVRWKQRLQEANAISNNLQATSTELQRAEGETRIALEDMIEEIHFRQKGESVNCHKLRAARVRGILLECGCENPLADRVFEIHETANPAHHADVGYAPERERIRRYCNWLYELGQRFGIE